MPESFAFFSILAEQTLPTMDGTYWAMFASRVLHILGAIILIGGAFYLRTVIHRAPNPDLVESPDQAFGGSRAKWAMWVGIATLLLIISGLFNYIMYMRIYERFAGPYHMMFGIKFLLALALFFIAAILAGRTGAADRFRQNIRTWLSVIVLLGIVIVGIAAIMRTVPHVPKGDDSAPPLVAPKNAPADE